MKPTITYCPRCETSHEENKHLKRKLPSGAKAIVKAAAPPVTEPEPLYFHEVLEMKPEGETIEELRARLAAIDAAKVAEREKTRERVRRHRERKKEKK